jgi:hypothetical protein
MKLLKIDIETAPNLALVWGMFHQNISPNQLRETCHILCFAAQWHGKSKIEFGARWEKGGEKAMLTKLHALLDEADAVIHYNGKNFDMPHINKAFLVNGMKPPVPYKQIDLLQVVRKQFKFTSNKLEHVAQELGIGRKVQHYGFQLWVDVMEGKRFAQKHMKKYNKMDVELLGDLYEILRPWITNHPNMALYNKKAAIMCPNCGGTHLQKRGITHTNTMSYQRLRCSDCGTWSRERSNCLDKLKKSTVLTQEKS